jgi:hypothetical protein
MFRSFDIAQQNPEKCSVCSGMARSGTFIIICLSVYILSTFFIVNSLANVI